VIKEVFERWAEEVNHEDIMETFLTEVIDIGNTGCLISVILPWKNGSWVY
jgi:hypothetical protein